MNSISFWSILVAAVVAFVIGGLWYSPILFGKKWMELKGMSEKDITPEAKKGMWKLYVGQLITTIVTFIVLGFFVSNTTAATAGQGAFLALIAWIGFSFMGAIGDLFWNKTPLKLMLINEACVLICWVVGGAIIGGWR